MVLTDLYGKSTPSGFVLGDLLSRAPWAAAAGVCDLLLSPLGGGVMIN